MPKPSHAAINAQQRDVAIIKQHLAGQDISCQPLWFRDRGRAFMTYAGAVEMTKLFGFQRETISVKKQTLHGLMNEAYQPITVFHAVVRVFTPRQRQSSRFGASSSKDAPIAIELAFRNAVRQLMEY